MIVNVITPAHRAESRAQIIMEQQEHFNRLAREREERETRLAAYRDELQKHWAAQFKEAATRIARDHRIPAEKAECILAQITAGEIPNFRASFYDEL